MNLKGFKIYLCAIVFGIIQMSADAIRAAYECRLFLMIYHTVFLLFMIYLFRWAYRRHKRECKENGTKAGANK